MNAPIATAALAALLAGAASAPLPHLAEALSPFRARQAPEVLEKAR